MSWIRRGDFLAEVGCEHTIKSGEVSRYEMQRGKQHLQKRQEQRKRQRELKGIHHLLCSKYFVESFTLDEPPFINEIESQVDHEAYSPQNMPPVSTELGLKQRYLRLRSLWHFLFHHKKAVNLELFKQTKCQAMGGLGSQAPLENTGRWSWWRILAMAWVENQ